MVQVLLYGQAMRNRRIGPFGRLFGIRRAFIRIAALSLTIQASVIGGAAIWATVPMSRPTMPLYFSGTNCRASGAVHDNGEGVNLTSMKLWINGTLVKQWPNPGGGGGPMSPRELAVMFDSTHFADGTQIEVKFEAWLLTGQHLVATGTSYVMNRSKLYGRYDLDRVPLSHNGTNYYFGTAHWKSVPIVEPIVEAMSYTRLRP